MLYETTYPIADSFVNLTIIQEEEKQQAEEDLRKDEYQDRRINSFEDIHKPKKPIQLTTIFDPQKKADVAPKRIIIEGRAGIGKTTLCQYIVNQWSEDNGQLSTWRQKFDVVVWLSLREIAMDADINFKNYSLSELIYERYLDSDEREEHPLEEVKKLVRELIQTERILLVLDGYDEITTLLDEKPIFKKFITEQFLNRPYWILTSRPYYTSDLKPDRRLENMGFISEDIPRYIEKFFTQLQHINHLHEAQKSQKLLTLLKSNINIHGIAHIPINLELICSVWEQDKQVLESPLSMATLYDRMVLNLLRRYLHKFQKKSLKEVAILEWPDILQISICKDILNFLAVLAWNAMQNSDVILPAENIKALAAQHFPDPGKRLELAQAVFKDFGLLKALGMHLPAILHQDHYFIHLTFQEYFAARYFITHWEEQFQAIEMLNINIQDRRYQVVWWFVAGLLGLQQSANVEIIKTFFTLLTKSLEEKIENVDQLVLVLRCWDESGLINLPEELVESWIDPHVFLSVRNYDFDQIQRSCLEQSPELSQKIAQVCLGLLPNKDSDARSTAVEVLGSLRVKTEPVIQGLLGLLQDADSNVRSKAADALGSLKVKTDLVIQGLLSLLQDEDSNVCCTAAFVLVKLGVKTEPVIQRLLGLLQNEDSFIRYTAADTLVSLGIKTEPVVQCCLDLLQNKSSSVRRRAVEIIVKLAIRTEPVFQGLLGLLQDKEASNRHMVAEILKKWDADLSCYETSIVEYDQAIALDSKDVNAFFNRAITKVILERYEEAIADFDQVIVLDATHVFAFYARGITKFQLGYLAAAIADFDQVVTLDPENIDVFNNRGLTKYHLNLPDHAIEDFKQAIQLDSAQQSAGAFYCLARYADQGLYVLTEPEIQDYYQKALKLCEAAGYYYYMGRMYQKGLGVEKDENKAIDYYERAIAKKGTAVIEREKSRKHLAQLQLAMSLDNTSMMHDVNFIR